MRSSGLLVDSLGPHSSCLPTFLFVSAIAIISLKNSYKEPDPYPKDPCTSSPPPEYQFLLQYQLSTPLHYWTEDFTSSDETELSAGVICSNRSFGEGEEGLVGLGKGHRTRILSTRQRSESH